MAENNWYSKKIIDVFKELDSGEAGLGAGEARKRLAQYGRNKLPEAEVDSLAKIFLRQFRSPLIYILFFAAIIVLFMGELIDTFFIFFVLLFNAVVGTIQEGKAQNTLLALRKFVETKAVVVREGKEIVVDEKELVPGDVIILREGEKVPADARITFSNALTLNEAALTGESAPVYKTNEPIEKPDTPLADRKNMVFMGTSIFAGNGRAVVAATGLNTFIGKISEKIAAIDTEIPLEADIRRLSRLIIWVVVVISVILFSVGFLVDKSAKEMFATVVAISVSIIPEGLPIVITLVLAAGVWRMSKRNALVKRLQAVEALGQARVIAVDKTGTITKNEMVVQKAYVDGRYFEIGGLGYEKKGDIRLEEQIVNPLNHPGLIILARAATFSSEAQIVFNEKTGESRIYGDPTEAAMLVFAEKIGFQKDEMERESPKIAEIPFDYKYKYHAAIRKFENKELLTIGGAPEVILDLSTRIWRSGKTFELNRKERENLDSIFGKMSHQGLRVLGLGVSNEIPENFKPEEIKNLTFVGFLAMKDPLRPEIKESIEEAFAAGIRVIMITGDHKITAREIAKEAGIFKEGEEILTGKELDEMSDKELEQRISKIAVFARVTPEHKLRIIKAHKDKGEIIAMTGDGVNDAPSLVAADLGVAMGKIGTEVAKEASDIVLLDDNFRSIIAAIEEGRSIYKTVKKTVLYLFSTSLGEVFTIGGAILLGYPIPLLARQIIWLNLVTDGFLTVALAMEPKEKGLLSGKFKRPSKYFVDFLMGRRMFMMALAMMLGTLFLFKDYFSWDIDRGRTIALTVLAVFQWFNAWNCRSENKSILEMGPFSNKFLLGATIFIIFLQIFAIYNPFMQKILLTTPLTLAEWLIIVPIALSVVFVEEIRKFFARFFPRDN